MHNNLKLMRLYGDAHVYYEGRRERERVRERQKKERGASERRRRREGRVLNIKAYNLRIILSPIKTQTEIRVQ